MFLVRILDAFYAPKTYFKTSSPENFEFTKANNMYSDQTAPQGQSDPG